MKKKYQITLVVIGCLIALLGLSYAYFAATNTGGGKGGSTTVETVTLDEVGFNIEGMLEFNDLDIYPGHKNISKIKVTALGNNDTINYKLVWEGINTLNTPLRYYVYKTTTNEEPSITCKKEIEQVGASKYYYETCTNNSFDNIGTIVNQGEIAKATDEKEFILENEEVIKGTETGEEIYYYVVLEYPNLEESQNIDMGGKFEGQVTVKKDEDKPADITIKKMYKQTDTGYEETTTIPENHNLNTEKSTCTNSAIPKLKNNKIVITNLTTSGVECNIYFDKDSEKPIINDVTINATETEISVTIDATDNVGITEYYYKIDDNEYVKVNNNSYTFTGLTANTNHTISTYVKDASGNQSETATKNVTTPDTTKPIINNVTSNVTMTEINVIVEATDNVDVTEYWYSIDNGEYIEGTSTYKFSDLGIDTSHTISVYVKDASGNQSDTSTHIIKTAQDNENPVISEVTTTADETTITINVSATDNVGVTEYYYQLDSNDPVKTTSNTHTFTGLGASTNHIINVYVKDNAGNQSDITTKDITTIDITKPTISNITTSGTETEITVTITADDNVGVTEYYFAIDNNEFSKSTTNTFRFAGLRAGVTHTIKAYVKDAAGNQSNTSTKSVTTPDTTNPIVDNITTSVSETEINVTVSATDNTEVAEYWYAIDNNEFIKGTGNTYKFTGLTASSTHTVKVYVKDKFGNQSETLTSSVTTIDDTKPTINSVTNSVTMTEISVTVDASDNVGVTEYWYKIDSGSYTKGTGNTKTFTGLGINTSHTVSIYVKDAAGNQSDTSTNVIVTAKDTSAPTISNVSTSVTETTIKATVTASDNVGVTEYWYAIDSGSFKKGTGNTYTFSGLSAKTSHTIKVYVKDAAGNQSTTTTKSVTTSDTTNPTISDVTLSADKTSITVTVTATDNVKVSNYYYQINSNSVVSRTSNTYTFTGLTAGTEYTIKVYVRDSSSNQSTTTTKTVTTKTLAEETLSKLNITPKDEIPDFSVPATTDEGVFKVPDGIYGGTSYYWRGAVTNNYMTFAGFCWRIVRINGDGSIRLIYDGATCHANGTGTIDSIAENGIQYNTSSTQSNYVGWTYTGKSQRPTNTATGASNNVKSELESWYSANITGTNANKIVEGKYCNDRDVASGYTWAITPYREFYYAAYERLNTNKLPTLSCPSGDVYTLSVGLITADEAAYAGGVHNIKNANYYLYNGSWYWAMSPYHWNGTAASVFSVYTNGSLGAAHLIAGISVDNKIGIRPVINLNSNVTFSGGTGTQNDPYVVS